MESFSVLLVDDDHAQLEAVEVLEDEPRDCASSTPRASTRR